MNYLSLRMRPGRHLFTLVALLLIIFKLTAQVPDKNFHVYLLAGQSNMAGRGPIDSLSKIVNPKILMLNKDNVWVPATDPVHFDKPAIVGVGPAIAFAQEMLKGDSTIRIGLIPCAWGGSPLRVWEPDSAYLTGHPYDDAIARTKLAMQTGVLKGIIWHQGEADNSSDGIIHYTEKLNRLINRFRKVFNRPALPFVAGEIGYFNKSTLINPVLDSLPNKIAHTLTVSAAGLTDKGDGVHFDTLSVRELGKRYGVAMKKLLAEGK